MIKNIFDRKNNQLFTVRVQLVVPSFGRLFGGEAASFESSSHLEEVMRSIPGGGDPTSLPPHVNRVLILCRMKRWALESSTSTLSDASKSALRNFATSLKANPDTDIRIIGFTDNTGKVDYNQTLSEKRAKSVYDYLMMQGVSSDRMVYEGKGIHDPVASNDTPEGRSLNRRVEIVILANQKMIQEAQQGTLR